MINTNIGIANTIASAPETVTQERRSPYATKKDYEATIEEALAYTFHPKR